MKYSKEEKTMWLEDWKQSGKSTKQNGVEPFLYLRTLFEKAPFANASVDWEKPLPWNILNFLSLLCSFRFFTARFDGYFDFF